MEESKRVLEKHLDYQIDFFAWPRGWFNDDLIKIAEDAGYKALLTTLEGKNVRGGNVLKIKRYFVDGSKDMKDFTEILQQF